MMILHIIPHTHWDREWYEPFEGYRLRLVQVVDSLLEVLEGDPAFHWHFDGQTAAIEDFLAVRPEQAERVRSLVRSGRLSVGPWRILMDEFLCSGETIIRNLRQGMATATSLGASPTVGYIPDSFGHIEQMPQILALAGMKDALVWRGVPSAVNRPVFRWSAPDGTELRAIYLATSYSNAATLPATYEDLIIRAKRILEDMAPFDPPGVVVGMNGSDHVGPQAHLTELFAQANRAQDEIEFRIGSVPEYLAGLPDDAWPRWRGEMRSSARANLLMGVLSARMPLKQKEFAASAALERYAEPLCALSGFDPGTMLDECWRSLVENSAHDSVCGCGIDDVASAVAMRYDKATFVARAIAGHALTQFAAQAPSMEQTERVLVWNPSPFTRSGIAEALIHLPDPSHPISFVAPDASTHPAQVIESTDQIIVDMKLRGDDLARLVPAIHSRKMGHLYVNDLSVRTEGSENIVELGLGTIEIGAFDIEAAKRTVEAAIASKPRSTFRVFGKGPPLARVLVQARDVPGFGFAALQPIIGEPASNGLTATESSISNEHLLVQASTEGIALIDRKTGASFAGIGLIDGGDAGDEYTWSPPKHDLIIQRPVASVWTIDSSGSIEYRLVSSERWRVPQSLDPSREKRSRRSVEMQVTTTYSLRSGERFARVHLDVQNTATDHRLRFHIPLPFTADASHADQSFAVVRRGLTAESGPHETGTPTFPSRRWVDVSDGAQGLCVLHRGTPEYEVEQNGAGVFITLLRCVGWLSRQDCSTRTGPAGPALPAPGAQLLGSHSFSLALFPHKASWSHADAHRVAEEFAYPFATAVIRGAPPEPMSLQISPACVQLSAFHVNHGKRELRIYNASDDHVSARIECSGSLAMHAPCVVNVLGNETSDHTLTQDGNGIRIELRPWQIATIRL